MISSYIEITMDDTSYVNFSLLQDNNDRNNFPLFSISSNNMQYTNMSKKRSRGISTLSVLRRAASFDMIGELKPGYLPISLSSRKYIRKIVENICLQIFLFLLVMVDCGVGLDEVLHGRNPLTTPFTVAVLSLLIFEVFLRFLYKDVVPFFTNVWCVLDLGILGGSIVFELSSHSATDRHYITVLRVLRFLRIIVVTYRREREITQAARIAVSQNRRRFTKDGFDIDITFITSRLLAMSIPAVGTEKLYRNPIGQVSNFFNNKFPNQYRIYNCCPERKYPYSRFNNEVYEYFMEDHNPTILAQIIDFCHHIHAWFLIDHNYVAAVHCKGGKGRTGTLICSYLLYSYYNGISTAKESMAYFANRRMQDNIDVEGVEARSQVRYVKYMEVIISQLQQKGMHISELKAPIGPNIVITKIRVIGAATMTRTIGALKFEISKGLFGQQYMGTVSDYVDNDDHFSKDQDTNYCDYEPRTRVEVSDDIKLSFYAKGQDKPLFGCWWHTYFETGEKVKMTTGSENSSGKYRMLRFHYGLVDGIRNAVQKKKTRNLFPRNFEILIFFYCTSDSSSEPSQKCSEGDSKKNYHRNH